MPTLCRHCGDTLPEDAPNNVTSCRGYCRWLARLCGDTLTENKVNTPMLLAHFCALRVILRGMSWSSCPS
jgi:hypothetical protein